tara:strand:- start:1546 stop:1743 length:198 start_codon:yes stop_codon:yes gene_type:complete
MKRNMEHVLHSVMIAVVLYFVMTLVLKQSSDKACSRSLVLGASALIYMVAFGHNFPPKRVSSSLL